MSNVYVLRPDTLPNDDTVKCLAQMLALARKGRIKGVGFIAYIEGNEFIANSCGAAYEDPTNSIGMLFALARKMSIRLDGGHL